MAYRIFLISDSTGITAERLCQSLLSQFQALEFNIRIFRYIDTSEKVQWVCQQIAQDTSADTKPIVISTLVEASLRAQMQRADAHVLDVMSTFLSPMEQFLGLSATPAIGQTHGKGLEDTYKRRMDAVTYALQNDDGANVAHYDSADVILVGVSRSGKTPVSLYLALEYGLFAANYPFVDEDLNRFALPASLQPHRDKLFGLTISASRLHEIRQARRPDSQYASRSQCEHELRMLGRLYKDAGIPAIDVTTLSVEEIATRILQHLPE